MVKRQAVVTLEALHRRPFTYGPSNWSVLMLAWLQQIVIWVVGGAMAAFLGVFVFSMWITLTNRYRPKVAPREDEKPKQH